MIKREKKKVLYLHFNKESKLILTDDFEITNKYVFRKDFEPNNIELTKFDIIILGPGKSKFNPKASDILKYVPKLKTILANKKCKILGLCYGLQLLCHYNNHTIEKLDSRHKTITTESIPNMKKTRVRFNHQFKCKLRENKKITMKKSKKIQNTQVPIFIKFTDNHYGIQFHFTNKHDRSTLVHKIINGEI